MWLPANVTMAVVYLQLGLSGGEAVARVIQAAVCPSHRVYLVMPTPDHHGLEVICRFPQVMSGSANQDIPAPQWISSRDLVLPAPHHAGAEPALDEIVEAGLEVTVSRSDLPWLEWLSG